MKIIRVTLPDDFLQSLETFGRGYIPPIPRKKLEDNYNELYNYCIFCEKPIHRSVNPYKHNRYSIIELRPCCKCLKEYNGKTLQDLPASMINAIEKRIQNFLELIT